MAEATIKHFKSFDDERAIQFAEKVRLAVGKVVYGLEPEDVTPAEVTVLVPVLGSGSSTSASSSTEVGVDLCVDEWPKIGDEFAPVSEAIAKCERISRELGAILLGGVNGDDGAIVNVWTRQSPATGWFDASTNGHA